MNRYVKAPFPRPLFTRFNAVADSLGYGKRGDRWKLLDLLLAYAAEHPTIFRKR
jgi:hypothetical protein